jgi:hypothetical protein
MLDGMMDVEEGGGMGGESENPVVTVVDVSGTAVDERSMGSGGVASVGSFGSLGGSSSSLPKKRKKEVENLKLGRGMFI